MRLPMLNAVFVPGGTDEAALRRSLLDEGIEVGGGLGPFAGRILRIGLMGHGARKENVLRLVEALGRHLGGDGTGAVLEYYEGEEDA